MNRLSSPFAQRRLILVAVVLLFCVPLIWLAVSSPKNRVKLPDGREFTVLAVTHGTNHQITFGPGWLRPFEMLLPSSVRRRLGVAVSGFSTSTPALVVWGGWRHDAATNQAARLASVAGAEGRETEPKYPDLSTYHPTAGLVMAWAFPNFPCRQSEVDFSIHDFGKAFAPVRRATIPVPNPSRRPAHRLTPMTLPAEVADGPWTLRMLRLTSSPPVKRFPGSTGDFEHTWGTAYFQILRDGRPDDAWAIESMIGRDAVGHVVETLPVHRQRMGDEWFWLFTEPLWPANEALRFEVEFARLKDFSPNDVLTTPLIAVPTNDVPEQVAPKWERHGLTLATVQLQRATTGPRGFGEFKGTHLMRLTSIPAVRGVRLRLIDVQDDRGRPVPHQTEITAPGSLQLFSLSVPSGVRELRAQVAVPRSRFAEFVVKPESTP